MIHLHQPVKEIIDDFNDPVHEKVTMFHLLTHTSGLVADPDNKVYRVKTSWSYTCDLIFKIPHS